MKMSKGVMFCCWPIQNMSREKSKTKVFLHYLTGFHRIGTMFNLSSSRFLTNTSLRCVSLDHGLKGLCRITCTSHFCTFYQVKFEVALLTMLFTEFIYLESTTEKLSLLLCTTRLSVGCVFTYCWLTGPTVFQHFRLFGLIGHWFQSNYDYQSSKIETLFNIVRDKDVFINFLTGINCQFYRTFLSDMFHVLSCNFLIYGSLYSSLSLWMCLFFSTLCAFKNQFYNV